MFCHLKKILLVSIIACSTWSAFAAPWPGYGQTTRTPLFKNDPNVETDYLTYGPLKSFSSYPGDPSMAEGHQAENPLTNPDYESYNVIVVVNNNNPLQGRSQTMRVYSRDQGGLVYYWLISTGMDGFGTTKGFFTPQSFSSRHWSGQYDAPMFWSVFFEGGKALHSSLDNDALANLGHPYSHGCVHIEENRAKELFYVIGQSGYGWADQIDTKTGKRITNSQNGLPSQKQATKTLIMVY